MKEKTIFWGLYDFLSSSGLNLDLILMKCIRNITFSDENAVGIYYQKVGLS